MRVLQRRIARHQKTSGGVIFYSKEVMRTSICGKRCVQNRVLSLITNLSTFIMYHHVFIIIVPSMYASLHQNEGGIALKLEHLTPESIE